MPAPTLSAILQKVKFIDGLWKKDVLSSSSLQCSYLECCQGKIREKKPGPKSVWDSCLCCVECSLENALFSRFAVIGFSTVVAVVVQVCTFLFRVHIMLLRITVHVSWKVQKQMVHNQLCPVNSRAEELQYQMLEQYRQCRKVVGSLPT